MAKILIKGGRIWDGEKFFYSDILTSDNIIEKIEPNITDSTDYVYNAEGKTVSAGLVDIHVHMLISKEDGYGIHPEMSCFPFGVTSAADAGRTHGERAAFDFLALKNLVFVTARIKDNEIDFTTLSETIHRFGDKVAGVKIYFDERSNEVRGLSPLIKLTEFAKKQNLRVMVHCSRSPSAMPEILDTLNEGDILTHAYHGGKNNASEDGFKALMAAKSRGVIIDAGFAGHIHTDFAVFKSAVENGALPNTISTDITNRSAYTRGGRYGMTMCMSIAKHLGMSEEDIFTAVTTAPAKALGKENEWGKLKVSGIADIAVFDYTEDGFSLTDSNGNHIESEMGYRCVLTISDGTVVFKD